MSEVLRYIGVAKESTFGTKVAPKFFIDQSSSDLNPPDGAELIKPGGLTRHKRAHAPGMYVPEGSVEFVADPPLLWYILWILLGDKTTVDNTTPRTGEATPADGSGIISATLANTPVVPGTLLIDDSGATLSAHDDGFGNIVEDGGSGISGTIDYATGVIYATGGTPSEAYVSDYDDGTFEHTIESDNDQVLPSATLKLGKDEFMHTFVGCAFSQIELAIEREWGVVTLNVVGQKDEKETILTLPNITIPQGYPLPFHKTTIQAADYSGSLANICAKVEALTLSINNNADGEAGITLCSRYPRKVYGGDLEITMDLTLSFDSTDELEDFWGGASGPSDDGTTEKKYQLVLDGGPLGTITVDIYRAIMTTPPTISPSGRERIQQTFSIEAFYDEVAGAPITFVCDSVYNYS
jgi:hypothetical protein